MQPIFTTVRAEAGVRPPRGAVASETVIKAAPGVEYAAVPEGGKAARTKARACLKAAGGGRKEHTGAVILLRRPLCQSLIQWQSNPRSRGRLTTMR